VAATRSSPGSQLFAVLVGLQAAHSTEETVFRLYDLLPYISWADRFGPAGAFALFVVLNTLFVLFGIWCYLARVRPKAPGAGALVTLWVFVETLNGVLHLSWSLLAGRYIPGTGTAPFVLVTALALYWRWSRDETAHAVT
jgi:hypothetical protein